MLDAPAGPSHHSPAGPSHHSHHITHLLVRGGRAAVVGVDVHGSVAAEDDPGGDATVHAL